MQVWETDIRMSGWRLSEEEMGGLRESAAFTLDLRGAADGMVFTKEEKHAGEEERRKGLPGPPLKSYSVFSRRHKLWWFL